MAPAKPIRVGIVAGEVSGDFLGAGLMRALKKRLPGVRFTGIAGPRMQAEGCVSLFPMEALSLIGFEAVGRYPVLARMRRRLAAHFLGQPPDVFIGIDAPDFNLGLERRLRAHGVRTVHYVSPTVWAWRGYRIRAIRRAVDRILTLFPFEQRYYRDHGVPVTFVGHPLADRFGGRPAAGAARRRFGLPRGGRVVALLPGSRTSELRRHASLFVRTARWLQRRHPDLYFVAPFASAETRALFEQALRREGAGDLPVALVDGHSREVLAACDLALLASGTAALEAALLGKPMVVTYRVSWPSYFLIRLFAHVRLYSLPNHLAGRELVPEFMQYNAVPEKLGRAIERYLTHPEEARIVSETLRTLGRGLRRNADERAAEAVVALLRRRKPRRAGHDAG